MENNQRSQEPLRGKKMLSVLALGIVALLGISLVAAYQGDYSVKGPSYSSDRHEAMEEIFDNFDYDAWVTLMTEDGRHPRVVDIVTEDTFVTFVEAHDALEDGDFDRAAELRSELGLNNGIGLRDGNGFGGRKGMKQGSGMKNQRNFHLK